MEKVNERWVRGGCIGRGAYGTVNLGVRVSNGAVFAVKSVDFTTCLPSQLQSLENEIRILKSISSPFIVRYLGDDTTSCYRNLHMEYLPRGTAAELASSDCSEESVRRYAWCLVSALSYLHDRGITHCDVKGKNVLLGGSPGSAKLADFGSALEFRKPPQQPTRGSPLWMAPEVIRGEYQGPESDVWSLGCTIIEMMTGKPAWEANPDSIWRIGYSDELPLFPDQLSSSGRDFLEKCLRRDYRKRWRCDQLLHHPFLSICSSKDLVTYSSPRCVLDGCDFAFDDEKIEGEEEDESVKMGAEERIRRLGSAVGVRANWEFSDVWVEVRRGGVEDEEGTSSEYFELLGVDEEVHIENGMELSSNSNINVSRDEENYNPIDDVAMTPRTHCNAIYFQEMKILPSLVFYQFIIFLKK